MLFIFILAGAFSGIAGEAGGAYSTANFLLSVIPPRYAVPGLFIIACLVSMAMGTSVGTITVIVPIAAAVSQNGGLPLALCTGVVVGGAMFGDNLSFISDTTIAATKTQGVSMKDKFWANIKLALPSAIITLAILVLYALIKQGVPVGEFDYNIWQAAPYFIVLALSIFGINVFLVLLIGIILFIAAGIYTGSLAYASSLSSMGNGITGMFETMIVTILVASIAALMRENGGFEAILEYIRKRADSKKGGMTGIACLTAFMDVATANNTVAIVIAGPIAKDISNEYNVDPKETASLLDTCSCIMQGIIPYGAQLLIAAGIAGIPSFSLIPFLIYPFVLAAFVALHISRQRTPEEIAEIKARKAAEKEARKEAKEEAKIKKEEESRKDAAAVPDVTKVQDQTEVQETTVETKDLEVQPMTEEQNISEVQGDAEAGTETGLQDDTEAKEETQVPDDNNSEDVNDEQETSEEKKEDPEVKETPEV